ncbi:MAG TPA: 6-carboxytetrahydropterin synthase QueD [Candidatus Cloacimonas acidaminovorans]|nr:6-carboxytetrahydropterin synthase QueD [Candidatus Cloacimonas acidaminovorans]HOI01851.1 6-carboxytetrahydropterin synthase QueD [Candidatus Cloacimonas acidaminovorans]HPV00448.1 6-carboxytetrahydropterin synthase QueD [Candidatus Cloacimonas acidaminovorans]HPX57822.1 6-carboxytetrahydropterin synthase QueD [Candidatus Cloacimonas acidaminovorans]HQC08272.1 6-carboxytetrahydropterin synthase QueD [Candidatus Cloacimonas acidaminovorans]
MFFLNVIETFSAAHLLRGYEGACSKLHGHNWKVRVCVKTKEQDEIGMAMDFGVLKTILSNILNNLDHSYLNEIVPFTERNPTSENLAKYIYECIEKELQDKPVAISEVEVYESEKSSVIYKNDQIC